MQTQEQKESWIQRVIDFSAHNSLLVVILAAVISAGAYVAMKNIPMDALPDLSDTQVILYSKWDRSPDIIEDQVTYPIIRSLLGAPGVKSIRGFSDFGYSYVYVIFEDGTDIYWARSRVLEYLSKILPTLPQGVQTEIGPDATAVGWIYQYAITDESGNHDLAELRSYQDWNLRYQLQSLQGVAEVASIGGFVKQYQVHINPASLLAYDLKLPEVAEAIRRSNDESGGRLLEMSGREYMIRGRGYIKNLEDIENIAVGSDPKTGTAILLKQLGRIEIGPDMRRGAADLDGIGDAPGGIVVMRQGENALNVIERVKKRIAEIEPYLPEGMKIVTTYDRSELIKKSIDTLRHTLVEEILIVSLVILLFLWHWPSASVAIITIPVSVFLAFLPMYFMGITSNLMSLAGIAISIGVLVDGAIVEVENAYKKIEHWLDDQGIREGVVDHATASRPGFRESFFAVRLSAMKEVGPSVFFSLLVIAVSFLPIFTLVDQEGRLFKPLAYSKNLAMAIASILAITLDPAIRMLYARITPFEFKPAWLARICTILFVGRYYREEEHPVSKVLFRLYEPACRYVLERPKKALAAAGILMATTVPMYISLGSEFMPPLNEGTILYMPSTLPGISVEEAKKALQLQDKLLKEFPEVERVYGKAGRADTSLDPAPFSMVETVVVLKPKEEWSKKERWFSFLPDFTHFLFRWIWNDRITYEELVKKMNEKMQIPGWTNAFTMPIRGRIDMLSTGIRTPIGIKVQGADLKEIEIIGRQIEKSLENVPGTRSVFAERVTGGYYLDFDLRREDLARYGLTVDDAQQILQLALGGETLTVTVEGRERYPVHLRYQPAFRQDLAALRRILVPTPSGAHIPMSQIADIHAVQGPSMIRDENGLLTGYVYVDIEGRDIGGYVKEAKQVVLDQVNVPNGYTLSWSGQYENMQRVEERLKIVLPLTLFLVVLLIHFNTKSWPKTGIVLLAVPFSLVGAIWFLWLLDYNVSIAVWVGMIALMGLDAETGTFMLLFLDLSYNDAKKKGMLRNEADLREAILHGAVKRVRPKIMTVASAFLGLIPILWSDGTGSDLMKRIAAPMVGGLITSFVLELLIYPVLYEMWRLREWKKPSFQFQKQNLTETFEATAVEAKLYGKRVSRKKRKDNEE